MKVVVGVVVVGVVILVGVVLGWALGANTVWRSFEALDQDDFGQPRKKPQQIHIAYGSSPSEMLITWSTYDNSEGDSGGGTAGTIQQLGSSKVLYGKKPEAGEQGPESLEGEMFVRTAVDVRLTIDNPNGAQWIHRTRVTVITHGEFLLFRTRRSNHFL